MNSFPIYILALGAETVIVAPEGRRDIGHTEFWERTVAGIVAQHFHVPVDNLLNLPYSQRRARVVGNVVYYGGRQEPDMLDKIRVALGNPELQFAHDDHERRLGEDVRQFRRLLRRYGP